MSLFNLSLPIPFLKIENTMPRIYSEVVPTDSIIRVRIGMREFIGMPMNRLIILDT